MPCKLLLLASITATTWAALAGEASQSLRPWTDYRTIMWVGSTAFRDRTRFPLFVARLREMGINTAMVYGENSPTPWLEHGFPYYVENVVNKGLCLKFNSSVKDWNRFVTEWAHNGRPETAFIRDYSLDDPAWQTWARDQMRRVATRHAPHGPLAYNIRDELSVTISANPFDYDFNPLTLGAFRVWLQSAYGTLEALNGQWQTRFHSWEEVRPFTTDQIKRRMVTGEMMPQDKPDWAAVARIRFDPFRARQEITRWNFSPWCDFRSYMDHALARELNAIRQVCRTIDPATPVGVEGTQMPSAWGGYDLWRLAQVLDWAEPYDIGNAREIFGSFMPGKPLLATVFEDSTPPAMRRLWHLLLEGDRGCIVWWSEDCLDWKSPGLELQPKARALAPVLREMTSPLARLFLLAERQDDPIGILYSQPSIQVNWLLESTVDGSTWHRRFSSHEASHNRMARVRKAWLKALQDLGYTPRFLAAPTLTNAATLRRLRCIVLPTALALSSNECHALLSFAAESGADSRRTLLADGTPGLFDEHGRLREKSPFEGLGPFGPSEAFSWGTGQAGRRDGDLAEFPALRLRTGTNDGWTAWLERQTAHVPREVTVPIATRTRVHRFAAGPARLLAFERNIDYQISEDLRQAGGNEILEKPVDVGVVMNRPAHVYDLRTQRYLGRVERFVFRLEPWRPSLFAVLSEPREPARLVEELLAVAERSASKSRP